MLGLAVRSIVIDGPNGVENVLRRKRAGSGSHRSAGWATARTPANCIQFAHDGWPSGAMNRPIYSASAAQPCVRGVDDRIHADLGDVADHQAELLSFREIDLHAANCTANAIVKS